MLAGATGPASRPKAYVRLPAMERRAFLKGAGALFALPLLGFSRLRKRRRSARLRLERDAQQTALVDEKPNILLIMTDDQPFYTVEYMEALKSLFTSEGMTFEQAWAGDPLCDPSRCCTLLGKHLHNHNMPANDPPGGGAEIFKEGGWEQHTYLYHLQNLGYDVGVFGKWLHNEWGHTPEGVDRAYTFIGSPVEPDYFDVYNSATGKVRRIPRMNPDGTENQDDTDFMRARAAEWIREREETGRPFVCLFTPFAPHGPYGEAYVPSRVEDLYRDVSLEPGPYDDPPEHYEATAEGQNTTRNRQEYRNKRKEIEVVDDAVRILIHAMDDAGLLANTYAFFTTDQPYMLGEHMLTKKGTFYDASSKVPLIVRGPGIAPGTSTRALASNVDLFATFLEIGGAPPELVASSDGRSLLPVLKGGGAAPEGWRERVLVEHRAGEGFRMIREKRYCYVEFDDGERLAYDMNVDPDQTMNIYPDLDAVRQKRLAASLAEMAGCSGAACRSAEGP